MTIKWLGHSSFLIETISGIRIITDPYQSGSYSGALRYLPIDIEADIVTVSHPHPDHNFTSPFTGAKIINEKGLVNVLNVEIEGVVSYHDKIQGNLRGRNIIFIIKTDGLKLVHLGDLGSFEFDSSKLKDADVLFIPIGGKTTLNAEEAKQACEMLNPRIILPMHFRNYKLDLDIDTIDRFIENNPDISTENALEITTGTTKSFNKKIFTLEPQY